MRLFSILQGFPVFEKSCFLFFCNFVKSHLGQCTLPEHIIPHIIRVFPDTHDLWHFYRAAWKPLQPDRNALLFIILEFDQKSLSGICISLLHKNTSFLTCAEVSRDIQIRQLFFHLILPVLLCVNALSCPGTPPALILSSSLSFLLPPYFLVPAKPAGFFLPPAFVRMQLSAVHSPFPRLSVLWFSHILTKTVLKESSGTDSVFFLQISGCMVRQSNENYDIPACNLPITKTAKICLSNYFLHKFWKNLERCITLDRSTGKSLSATAASFNVQNCTMHWL